MTIALVLVDIQNDYFPGGKMELSGIEQAAENASKLLASFRMQQLPVYHIQHISVRPGATFFLPDTAGVKINEQVLPLKSEIVIEKHYPNSFRDTSLLNHLNEKGIKHLVIAGAMSHMCIDATTRAAFDYHFECTVIEDACATKDLKFGDLLVPAKYIHAGFMSALDGTYAEIKSYKDFLLI
ncbi:MAG: isochorismatase [Gammaproteobacteria bacterium RIFCSPHIGHO2_12_FULL_35_23]|nr:MAG: isochorismatase [Gammaproteobacteria bacterium RIFCSPHIGHO2_12_FULL_35_23]HLB43187.1 cysteine hydrolase family protein [Gammaproteobacteria bacterium]